jgi:hypothetical protein
MHRVALVLVLAGLLATAPAGDARRRATTAERAAVARHMGVPARCARVYVSTVDRHFASYEFNARASRCTRYGSNGIDVLKRSGTRWRDLGGMSDCRDATIPHVPARVLRDLTRAFCAG